jgi:hypothetical protein
MIEKCSNFAFNFLSCLVVKKIKYTVFADIYLEILTYVKGTDRFKKFQQKFTELDLTKGCGCFLNFLGALMILKYKK